MTQTLIILPSLAAMLLAAHFYRAGDVWVAAAALAAPLLLAVPRPWAARVVQAVLVVGALEWVRALAAFVSTRVALGQPTLRLTLILLAVAVFTAASAAVFWQPRLRRRYGL